MLVLVSLLVIHYVLSNNALREYKLKEKKLDKSTEHFKMQTLTFATGSGTANFYKSTTN